MKKLLQIRLLSVIMLAMLGISAYAGTAEVTIGTYASQNGWTNGTQYTSVEIENVATATVTGGSNTGKYYDSGSNWRLYQNESPQLTISGNEGFTVTSVTITYSVDKTGVLIYNGNQVPSGTTTEVTDNEIVFSVGNTKSGVTNGQVRVTKIEVEYVSAGGVSIDKPSFGTESGIVAVGTTVALTCTTAGASIYYATEAELGSANPTAAEIVAANHKGTSITVNATNTYFAVATDGENYSGITSASYIVLAHAGTEADPYNVADAIIVAKANGTTSDVNVYVTGYIAKINSNTAFFITDAADGTGDQLEIYNATNANDFEYALGDKVVVCAPLMMYYSTPETKGGTIISVTGKPACGLAWSEEEFTYTIGETDASELPTLSNPNNLTVTYSSSDETVATIAADGTVTVVAPGVTIIEAKFAGNDSFKPGVAKYTFKVVDPNLIEDVVDVETLPDFTTEYKDYIYNTSNGLTYVVWGYKSAGIQFNANKQAQSGLVITNNVNNYAVKSVTVDVSSISSVNLLVIGSDKPYSGTEDISNASDRTADLGTVLATITAAGKTTITPTKEYKYICICPASTSGSGVIKVTSVTTVWTLGSVDIAVGATGYATMYYGDRALTVPEGISGWTFTANGEELEAVESFKTNDVIPAGEAVVLYTATPGNYQFALAEGGTPVAANDLKGTDDAAEVNFTGKQYVLGNGTNGVGFYLAAPASATTFTNGAHKAYLEVSGAMNAPAYILNLGNTTGVKIIAVDAEATEDATYNVLGQKVGNNYKGFVVKNGQKTINK